MLGSARTRSIKAKKHAGGKTPHGKRRQTDAGADEKGDEGAAQRDLQRSSCPINEPRQYVSSQTVGPQGVSRGKGLV